MKICYVFAFGSTKVWEDLVASVNSRKAFTYNVVL